eukprot:CAMPEP_0184490428 /NCGR_PEP_ID=MMETSP0113_2-20130426/17861_1 /TAXON_ID=91329 /ORGANISM="Norrisiella sphaerica, Strain BC52" /LENGTH=747 /DNA_ID=CAMNT_0026874307 /DNA_START=55 /DNA_END=2298 /DNA_ORIENTATION=-
MQHIAEVQIANQCPNCAQHKEGGSKKYWEEKERFVELRDVSKMSITCEDVSVRRRNTSAPVEESVLDPKHSAEMVDRVNEVLRPTTFEDLHLPSKDETLNTVKSLVPAATWIPMITWSTLKADIVGGLTVLVMLIPQSMSYADIAGMPLVAGLYSSFMPALVYSLTGNSRQLAVGPVAMVGILLSASLEGLLTEEECPEYFNGNSEGLTQSELCPEQYHKLGILTAFLVGLFTLAGALFQLGFIISFLGHPVISGFTSAAAVLIGLTQVKNLFGFKIGKSEYIYVTIEEIINNISDLNVVTTILGLSFVAMLYASKLAARSIPSLSWLRALGPLLFCVLGSVIVYFGELDTNHGVEVVGTIPEGLPPASVDWDVSDLNRVLMPSITIVIISYMESIAISKSLAAQHGYEVEPTQELFALGLANFCGSMLSAFPTTGSFSRSAVSNSVGTKTQLGGMITALGVLFTMVFLTPLFAYLPNFVLGAIVVSSVVSLVAYDEAIHLWHVKRTDCLLWVIAFLGTLFLGILTGLAIAVGMSLVIVIYESARPQISLIWRVPGTTNYRIVKQAPNGEWIKNILIVRFGASMYFANMSYLRDVVMDMLRRTNDAVETARPEENQMNAGTSDVQYIILEMSPVISVDSSAIHTLEDMAKEFERRGVKLAFANVGNRVQKVFENAHFTTTHGLEWFQPSTHDAVLQCLRHQKKHKLTVISEQTSEGKTEELSEERKGLPAGLKRTLSVEGDRVSTST